MSLLHKQDNLEPVDVVLRLTLVHVVVDRTVVLQVFLVRLHFPVRLARVQNVKVTRKVEVFEENPVLVHNGKTQSNIPRVYVQSGRVPVRSAFVQHVSFYSHAR